MNEIIFVIFEVYYCIESIKVRIFIKVLHVLGLFICRL